MREHQITISLRAEQFQELQRMARTAGAGSVSAFAKDKLLSAVGLSMRAPIHNPPRVQDLTSVTGELRRLHRELQVFIAETLSTKDYGYVVAAPERSTTSDAPIESVAYYSELPPPTAQDAQPDMEPIYQAVLAAAGAQAQAAAEALEPQYQEYAQAAKEAEELAERAFVISPRLGAIDDLTDHPMDFLDPLDELLGDSEAYGELAAQTLLNHQPSGENLATDPHTAPQVDYNDQASHLEPTNETVQSPLNHEAHQQNDEHTTHDSSYLPPDGEAQIEDSEEKPQTQQDSPPSEYDVQNRPPLSGGPPPRKRRT